MQLIVDHAALRKALDLCGSAKGGEKLIAILANVRLDAKNDKLTIAATDFELTVVVTVDAMVREAGSITIAIPSLLDITKTASDALNISTAENGRLNVTTGSAKYALPTLPSEDYPLIPNMDELGAENVSESGSVELSAGEILPMLRTVSYGATVGDDARFPGVYFGLSSKLLEVWATNGNRLALCELPGRFKSAVELQLPNRLIAASSKLSVSAEGTALTVAWVRSHVSLSLGNVTMIGRRSKSAYFQFRQIIPKTTVSMTGATESLASAVRRASPFSQARCLRCTFTKGALNIAAENAITGQSSDSADISYDGKEMLIGFDAKFLGEVFGEINTTQVELSLDRIDGPMIFRPVNSDLPFTALHLVMPMRLS